MYSRKLRSVHGVRERDACETLQFSQIWLWEAGERLAVVPPVDCKNVDRSQDRRGEFSIRPIVLLKEDSFLQDREVGVDNAEVEL